MKTIDESHNSLAFEMKEPRQIVSIGVISDSKERNNCVMKKSKSIKNMLSGMKPRKLLYFGHVMMKIHCIERYKSRDFIEQQEELEQ